MRRGQSPSSLSFLSPSCLHLGPSCISFVCCLGWFFTSVPGLQRTAGCSSRLDCGAAAVAAAPATAAAAGAREGCVRPQLFRRHIDFSNLISFAGMYFHGCGTCTFALQWLGLNCKHNFVFSFAVIGHGLGFSDGQWGLKPACNCDQGLENVQDTSAPQSCSKPRGLPR